jgi:hypothetical protein
MQAAPYFVALLCSAALLSSCVKNSAPHSQAASSDCPVPSDGGRVNAGTVVLLGTMNKLNLTNPIADVEANVARGDKRFIGINGYACDEPGLDEAHDRALVDRFHTHCLEGTSDVIGGNLDFALLDAAMAYARAYNRELVRRIHGGSVT